MVGFEPRPEDLRRTLHDLVDRLVDARVGQTDQRVFTPPDADVLRKMVESPFPTGPTPIEPLLEQFFDEFLPTGTRVDHPRFFAFIPCPGSAQSLVGAILAAGTNLFSGSFLGGTFLVELEHLVLRWLGEAMGLPEELGQGLITTGGSLANLCALAAARDRVRQTHDRDISRQRVYTSDQSHYSVAKATRVLGYEPQQCVELRADHEHRVRIDALQGQILADLDRDLLPTAVVATAGTTSTGAVDPLDDIADLCERHGLWLHVDAAYGGAMALLPEQTSLRGGLARADSITVDAHKWLYASIETGCLLTRHVDALTGSFRGDGAYLQDVPRDQTNFFERGPELTRGARSLRLWTLFRAVGFDALRDAVRNDCRRTRLAAELLLADNRFVLVTEPRMSIFSFRLHDDDWTRELLTGLQREGFAMLSSTEVEGRFAIRWCVVNARTTDEDIRRTVDHLHRLTGSIPI